MVKTLALSASATFRSTGSVVTLALLWGMDALNEAAVRLRCVVKSLHIHMKVCPAG